MEIVARPDVWKMASPETLTSNFGNYTIQGIEEIVFPPAVSWLPSTNAWKLLGIALFAMIAIALFRAVKQWRHNEYRRIALRKIAELRSTVRSLDAEHWQPLCELPALIKTVALRAYPREAIAPLNGQSWSDFLDNSAGYHLFDRDAADTLTELAYRADAHRQLSDADAENLLNACERWIQRHKTPIGAKAID